MTVTVSGPSVPSAGKTPWESAVSYTHLDVYKRQDYQNPEDELLGLMLVIAIDAANCSNG